ncbi:MAG: HAD-IA family hydrolase [Chloroflexi bacterium]|nr:HAD-IA family hydrolase [Chloroflexota bacterium]MDA1148206.1 HAD-IA family hydrolase [Chloroflexota bacterium]
MPPLPCPALQAVVFDMDGVLVDTEPIHYATACRLIAPAELPMSVYERFIGTHGFVAYLHETYGIAEDVIRSRSTELFLEEVATNGLTAMPGALAVIDAVRASGLATAVVTMTQPDWTEATLRAAGLRDRFDVVITVRDVEHGKPAPDLYLHAAERLGVDPRCSMALEDSVHGIASAVAAGMQVVQLRQATYVPAPQPSADRVIGSFAEFDTAWLERGVSGR